jgi:hypothetical protein
MKYLKRFLESRFESEEDVTDYLLELIDNGFLLQKTLSFKNVYDSSGNIVIGSNILYGYQISDKFKRIKNNEELENYTNNLSTLYKIIKRWNLNFSIIKDEIVIIDESPEYISEFVIKNGYTTFSYIGRGWERYGSTGPYTRYSFNSNLEFFITLKGTRKEIENFISNRIILSEKYQLKLTKESSGEVEYQIIPSE